MAVSIKHVQIDKARSNMLVVVAVATIVVVFCLMSTKALLGQAAYQRRVINARHAALAGLQSNVTAANQLVQNYNQVFEGSNPTNVIGGQNSSSSSTVPPNGDNARIVLDALPSKYDFPALISSVNYIMQKNGIQQATITGSDETSSAVNTPSPAPQPVPVTLTVTGEGSYPQVQATVHDFEKSIRPFDATSLQLTGSETDMTFTLNLTTYYQPAKSLTLTTKKVQ